MDLNKVKCHVAVCYRTPTPGIYDTLYHQSIQNLIHELGSTNKHFLLMGDCNYRFLHWSPTDSDSISTREAAEFCECLNENFLTQHVEECTRNDAILDLIVTDEPDMVHDLSNLGLFPGSDHNALLWSNICLSTSLCTVLTQYTS